MQRIAIRRRIALLLTAGSVLWGASAAGAAQAPEYLVDSGYSRVVLERLPADDIAEIVRTLPVSGCRPTTAVTYC